MSLQTSSCIETETTQHGASSRIQHGVWLSRWAKRLSNQVGGQRAQGWANSEFLDLGSRRRRGQDF